MVASFDIRQADTDSYETAFHLLERFFHEGVFEAPAERMRSSLCTMITGPDSAVFLAQRGVLYAPDYVVNAGGLMHAVPGSKEQLNERVWAIHDTLLEILEESAVENRPPHRVADDMARRIIAGGAE